LLQEASGLPQVASGLPHSPPSGTSPAIRCAFRRKSNKVLTGNYADIFEYQNYNFCPWRLDTSPDIEIYGIFAIFGATLKPVVMMVSEPKAAGNTLNRRSDFCMMSWFLGNFRSPSKQGIFPSYFHPIHNKENTHVLENHQ
jgi:hypothetical protein